MHTMKEDNQIIDENYTLKKLNYAIISRSQAYTQQHTKHSTGMTKDSSSEGDIRSFCSDHSQHLGKHLQNGQKHGT